MKQFYTVFFINKNNSKLIRRYSRPVMNKFFWKKEVMEQLDILLKNNPDLEKNDILVREYEGVVDNYDE